MPLMPGFKRLFRRHRGAVHRNIDDELRFHLLMKARDLEAEELSPEEARDEALSRFGDLEEIGSQCLAIQSAVSRQRSRRNIMDSFLQDLRSAIRGLLRRPGFAASAVLTLALGIGANAAMFSIIERVVLAPLPFVAPDRVVQVWDLLPAEERGVEARMSTRNFRDYENLNEVFSHAAAVGVDWVYVDRESRHEYMEVVYVSADLFDMMGVMPVRGRTFRAEEDVRGVGNIVLLTHAYWLREFGGEEVIGRRISLRRRYVAKDHPNYQPEDYEIIGVLPPDFQLPPMSMDKRYGVWTEPGVVLPLGLWEWGGGLRALAQLREGVTVEQARANLRSIAAGIAESEPEYEGLEVTVVPVGELLSREYGVALAFLWGATALVLLVACASVSSLLLGRGVARERELALRAALGAGARRIFRQLLTESTVIAAVAGVLGVLVAHWGIAAIKILAPAGVHRLDDAGLNVGVLGFTLCVSLVTVLLMGLWPALRGARRPSSSVLNAGGYGTTLAQTRSLRVLVTAEIALSLVLLAGAGLMLQTFWNLVTVDTGIAREQTLQVRTRQLPNVLAERARGFERFVRMRERVEAIPGVTSFAVVTNAPLSARAYPRWSVTIPGRPWSEAAEQIGVRYRWMSPGYFRTLGIPLLEGGAWDLDTGRTPGHERVLINESMARAFWPGESAVGEFFFDGSTDPAATSGALDAWLRFQPGDQFPDAPWPHEVIGVVADFRDRLEHDPTPEVYVRNAGGGTFFVRAAVDPAGLAQVLRREIEDEGMGDIEVLEIRTVEQIIAERSADSRFRALLIVFFAAMATGITCLGLFGVLTYAVAQRTRELGIRVALGAGNSHIAGLVLSQGARMVGLGVALGLVLVFWLTRYISNLLFGVVPLDPMTLAGGAALIFALALFAAYLPARRAMRVDPIEALRQG